MIVQRYLNFTIHLLVSCLFFLASCSDDAMVDFPDRSTSGVQSDVYAVCTDESEYEANKPLTISDLAGEYATASQLICGVAGCEEVPVVNVLYAGFTPSLILTEDGSISTPDGPFEKFDRWSLIPQNNTEFPNRLELRDSEEVETAAQVTVLEIGPCRLRLENNQGWIEFVRLEKL